MLSPPEYDLVNEVRRRVLGSARHDVGRRVADELDALLPLAPPDERAAVERRVVAELTGLGPLDALLSDPGVEEVMINAGTELWVVREGCMQRLGALPPEVFWTVAERVLAPLGRRLDRTNPIVDARLPDGSRLAAVIPPLAVEGPCLAIRRFRIPHLPLEQFAAPDVAALLADLIERRCNIVVCGATSSGKTTLLNSLVRLVPPAERIVTIEDTAELDFGARHVVRLETRPSTEALTSVNIRDLVRAALRLRPDRLIIGEVRGAEALDMIEALSTGHDGSLSTCHANHADDALRRLEFMAIQASDNLPIAAVRQRIVDAVDIVVETVRSRTGARRVASIAEVLDDTDSPVPTRVLATGDRVVGETSRWRS